MGRKEFDDWSDRIISGALVLSADHDSQKFALATMLMHLGPTEHHKADVHFIATLRKGAVNQVAHAVMREFDEKKKEKIRIEAEEKSKVETQVESDVAQTQTRLASQPEKSIKEMNN